jgi:hypothetical protein
VALCLAAIKRCVALCLAAIKRCVALAELLASPRTSTVALVLSAGCISLQVRVYGSISGNRRTMSSARSRVAGRNL